MSPCVDQGVCNLECWCHVPTRGVFKPPCYLCVINSCSLSSKQDVTPSAPHLSPSEERPPTAFPHQSSSTGRSQSMVAANAHTLVARAPRYGWQGTLFRNASLDLGQTNSNSRDIFMRLNPEHQPEASGGMNIASVQTTDLHVNTEELPQSFADPSEQREDGDGMAVEVDPVKEASNETETSDNVNDLKAKDNIEGSGDLTNMIRSLLSIKDLNNYGNEEEDEDEEDEEDDDDEEEAEEEEGNDTPARCSRSTNIRQTSGERNKIRRRRDKRQGTENYQGLYFYGPGTQPFCIPRVNRVSRSNPSVAASVQNESEFKRLHKIQRRDTSSEAARRYLQSDENLYRTWMDGVAFRRRNYPKRNRSARKLDEGNRWFTSSFDGQYSNICKEHQHYHSKDSGMDT